MKPIEIRKLNPSLIDDYIHFFDTTPHDDKIPEHTCYCVCWASVDHKLETQTPTREIRRNWAIEYIKANQLQGYLAYQDNKVVGWCNANTKNRCKECFGWSVVMTQVDALNMKQDKKTKSVFCFVIKPELKRQGIAKQLLEYAIKDAKNDGFNYIEAYPEKDTSDELRQFMGFHDLYKQLGFQVIHETKDKYIMRKTLTTK